MEIELKAIKVRDIYEGFANNEEEGVFGFGGKLNIRPKYQREFVYNAKQRNEVIYTIKKAFPLNVMYWVENEDGSFELLDGQQRTLSICSFIFGEFMLEWNGSLKAFHNLTPAEQNQLLDYELMVYICRNGSDAEKLEWFQVINIAGEKLTTQEIRNAVYCGSWVTEAKKKFSKTNCVAYKLAGDYMSGTPIRQDYLETVLNWISGGNIESYMAQHQHDANASPLWQYFQTVVNWVNTTFPRYRKEMKGLAWGEFYNSFKDQTFNAQDLETRIKKLMEDVDVTNKKGIYAYVLDGDERHLNVRAFDNRMKREAYERQNGICPHCHKHFEFEQMEGDHITPWSQGGKTEASNCQMLCKDCNRRKGGN